MDALAGRLEELLDVFGVWDGEFDLGAGVLGLVATLLDDLAVVGSTTTVPGKDL